MKPNVLRLVMFSLALSAGISAQKAQVADKTEQNLRQHVEYLAADKLEGRRTGEQGATFAAGYVSNMFAQFKLKGGIRDAKGKLNFLQPFPYVTGVEAAATGNRFVLEFTNESSQRMKIEDLAPVRAVAFSPNAEANNVSIVYAGFGITAADLKYDDYKDIDVKGKIVLIFDGSPGSDDPHSAFGRFDPRTKALIAKDKGAVGIILISREAKFDDERLTQMKYDQALGEAALPTFIAARNTAANILGVKDEELKTVEGLTAMKKDSSVKISIGFRDTKPVVSYSVHLVKKQADAYNVIGVLEGRDPVLKNEAIVIGAHFDHLGRGGQGSLDVNSTAIHHGADDNASGTSAIIELAREFAKAKKNKRTIIFIAFSGEEEGLIGSKFYVNNPVFPVDKTIAMINLDMVGRLNDNKLTVGGIGSASEFKSLVEGSNPSTSIVSSTRDFVTGKTTSSTPTPTRSYFTLQLNQDGFGPSDHASFYGKKIPVLFLFTGTHVDYHKPSDTAEKINYQGLTAITKYVEQIVKTIDNAAQRPTYTVAPSSGAMGGGRGFSVSLGTVPSYGDSTDGLLLDGVRDNSPAAKAGLKAGDKIVKLAGKDVRNVMDYTYVLGEMKAGQEYDVEIMRGTEKVTLKIIPAAAVRR